MGRLFLNKKAPEFVVEEWISQQPKLKGKFILIDFLGNMVWPVPEGDTRIKRVR